MKKSKRISRIVLSVLLLLAIAGMAVYETSSILRKEHVRQSELFSKAQSEVENELNLTKIAVISKEPESYRQNLEAIQANLASMKKLSFVAEENAEYLEQLGQYIEALSSKEATVSEMKNLDSAITKIKDSLSSSFKDEENISKDTVNTAEETIKSLRIDNGSYHDEDILKIIDSVNQVIDSLSGGAKELSECIDNCYENRFTEISDELSDKLKGPVEGFASLNTAYESLFHFEKLSELKAFSLQNS